MTGSALTWSRAEVGSSVRMSAELLRIRRAGRCVPARHYRCNPAGAVLVISDIWRCERREVLPLTLMSACLRGGWEGKGGVEDQRGQLNR